MNCFLPTYSKVKRVEFHPIEPWVAVVDQTNQVAVWNTQNQKPIFHFQFSGSSDGPESVENALLAAVQSDPRYIGGNTATQQTNQAKVPGGVVHRAKFLDSSVAHWQTVQGGTIMQGSSFVASSSTAGKPLQGQRKLVCVCENKVSIINILTNESQEIQRNSLDNKQPQDVVFIFKKPCQSTGDQGIDGVLSWPYMMIGLQDGSLRLVSTDNLKVVKRFNSPVGGSISCMLTLSGGIRNQGDMVVTGTNDGHVALWDCWTNANRSVDNKHVAPVSSCRCGDGEIYSIVLIQGPSKNYAVTASLLTLDASGRIFLWSTMSLSKPVASTRPTDGAKLHCLMYSSIADYHVTNSPSIMMGTKSGILYTYNPSSEPGLIEPVMNVHAQIQAMSNISGAITLKTYHMAVHPTRASYLAVATNHGVGLLNIRPRQIRIPVQPIRAASIVSGDSPNLEGGTQGNSTMSYFHASGDQLRLCSWINECNGLKPYLQGTASVIQPRISVSAIEVLDTFQAKNDVGLVGTSADHHCVSLHYTRLRSFRIYSRGKTNNWKQVSSGRCLSCVWRGGPQVHQYAVIEIPTPAASGAMARMRNAVKGGKQLEQQAKVAMEAAKAAEYTALAQAKVKVYGVTLFASESLSFGVSGMDTQTSTGDALSSSHPLDLNNKEAEQIENQASSKDSGIDNENKQSKGKSPEKGLFGRRASGKVKRDTKEQGSSQISSSTSKAGRVSQQNDIKLISELSESNEGLVDLLGGTLLGVVYNRSSGGMNTVGHSNGRMVQFLTWDGFKKVGQEVPCPNWIQWDEQYDTYCMCAMGYDDTVVIAAISEDEQLFNVIHTISIASTIQAVWSVRQLLITSYTGVYLVIFIPDHQQQQRDMVRALSSAGVESGTQNIRLSVQSLGIVGGLAQDHQVHKHSTSSAKWWGCTSKVGIELYKVATTQPQSGFASSSSQSAVSTDNIVSLGYVPCIPLGILDGTVWLADAYGQCRVIPLNNAAVLCRSLAVGHAPNLARQIACQTLSPVSSNSLCQFMCKCGTSGAYEACSLKGLAHEALLQAYITAQQYSRGLECLQAMVNQSKQSFSTTVQVLDRGLQMEGQQFAVSGLHNTDGNTLGASSSMVDDAPEECADLLGGTNNKSSKQDALGIQWNNKRNKYGQQNRQRGKLQSAGHVTGIQSRNVGQQVSSTRASIALPDRISMYVYLLAWGCAQCGFIQQGQRVLLTAMDCAHQMSHHSFTALCTACVKLGLQDELKKLCQNIQLQNKALDISAITCKGTLAGALCTDMNVTHTSLRHASVSLAALHAYTWRLPQALEGLSLWNSVLNSSAKNQVTPNISLLPPA